MAKRRSVNRSEPSSEDVKTAMLDFNHRTQLLKIRNRTILAFVIVLVGMNALLLMPSFITFVVYLCLLAVGFILAVTEPKHESLEGTENR